MHLTGDGHFNTMALGELKSDKSSFYAFGHHRGGGDDLTQLETLRQLQAHLTVAAQIAGAGEDQVAKSGQTGESFGSGAQFDGQTGEFGKAARNQSCGGVVAQFETVADACADGGFL